MEIQDWSLELDGVHGVYHEVCDGIHAVVDDNSHGEVHDNWHAWSDSCHEECRKSDDHHDNSDEAHDKYLDNHILYLSCAVYAESEACEDVVVQELQGCQLIPLR